MRKTILENLRSELLGRTSFDTLPEAVWIGASSLNTYGTNAIEGNTLTQAEVEAVLLSSKGVKRSMSDILETVQHERAFRNLVARRGRAIDLVTIQELHEDVFKGVMVDAGQWRRTSVTIQGAGFTPPRPEKIVPRLEELLAEYNRRDLEGEDPFTLGSWMHLEFEMIHPFSNGNGRVGRLLLNLHFLRHNWPPINVLPIDRDRYLSALQEGNRDGLDSMTALVEILMAGSLLTFLSQVGTSEDELRSLAELERGGAYSAKYLALRAKQGELPAVRIKHEWRSSNRALRLYIREVGRAGAS